MQEIHQALNELKELYQKVLGRPAPEIEPSAYVPFPLGADPVRMAVEEVKQLKTLSEAIEKGPAPAAWVPRADCFATKDGFIVHVEVPGVAREDLKVFTVGGEIVVRGERKYPGKPSDLRPLSIEKPWGPFERRIVLSPGKLAGEVAARYSHGILELRITGEPAVMTGEAPVEVA